MRIEFRNYTQNDIDLIKWQLGSNDVYLYGIIERCIHGFPKVILLDPVKVINGEKELNYEAISNIMWLTCPYLNDRIHDLENSGFIKSITDTIQNDVTLRSLMRKAHARFYFLRSIILFIQESLLIFISLIKFYLSFLKSNLQILKLHI